MSSCGWSVVCCVQFSVDGRYLATGCNRSAQIFDVKTGRKTRCVFTQLSFSTVERGGKRARGRREWTSRRPLYPERKVQPGRAVLGDGGGGPEDQGACCFPSTACFLFHLSLSFPRSCPLPYGTSPKAPSHRSSAGTRKKSTRSTSHATAGRIVSGSGNRTARVWDMDGGPPLILAVDEPASSPSTTRDGGREGPDAGVTSVALSPDGRYIAAGSLDNVVRIWDADSGVLLERLRGHRDSVGSLDKTLKHWDVSALAGGGRVKTEAGAAPEGRAVCTRDFLGHKDYVLSVAVSHDAQWIVSGSKDHGVQFWDRAGAVHALLQGHKNSVISIDLSPAGEPARDGQRGQLGAGVELCVGGGWLGCA
ncbi:putative TUP1-general transcription repressor [Mycena indigotica]|uniref:Putative TUP1-general transcription repressor n=1 Tax=Mycena indigotica TaxID=2126181 RepID=A0A8H6TEI9_9AGAR|nr:putative TUP1-general transcription repressor [Mycena indigotica]KAF7316020.1 putative TUP1-general transcription repressor [Mycena indigotica]